MDNVSAFEISSIVFSRGRGMLEILARLNWFSIILQVIVVVGFSLYYYNRGMKDGAEEERIKQNNEQQKI